MKNIFYCIFYAGALLGAFTLNWLDPAAALVLVVLFPIVALHLLERFGYFEIIEERPSKFPILDKVHEWGMEDDEAYKTYGHAIINELNMLVEDARQKWADAVQHRDKFIKNTKEIKT